MLLCYRCHLSRYYFQVLHIWFSSKLGIATFDAICRYLLSHVLENRVQELLAHILIDRVVDWLQGHDLLVAVAALRRSETYKASVIVCLHPLL